MSDYRAIGGASATLRALLLDRMEENVEVTIARPDTADLDPPRVNLFLYRIEESGSLKNQDLSGHAPGGALGNPPLALELYFMLTAYSEGDDHRADQELLGDAMRALHENAIVPKNLLDPSVEPLFESVRISIQPMSLDDLSKIWSASTKPFRLSVCYKVTAVLIESRARRQYRPPVAEPPSGGPRITAIPIARPRIERLLVIRQNDPSNLERPIAYARIGDRVVIEGSEFAAPTRLFFDDLDVSASIQSLSDRRIVVTLPDDAALQPGPVRVRIQSDVMLGEPPEPHRGLPSNLAVFVLVPRVQAAVFDGGPPRSVTITGSRLFQQNRPGFAVIGDTVVPAAQYAAGAQNEIEINIPDALAAGEYAVRVRLNGAESIDAAAVTVT